MKVHIGIGMFQGLVEEVKAFKDEGKAAEWFQKYTDVSFEEYQTRSSTQDSETILADYAGSMIYEVELE